MAVHTDQSRVVRIEQKSDETSCVPLQTNDMPAEPTTELRSAQVVEQLDAISEKANSSPTSLVVAEVSDQVEKSQDADNLSSVRHVALD